MPAPTEPSEVSDRTDLCRALPTCVPPHSSWGQASPISTTRTFSPYVSSKRAGAPSSFASGRGIHRTPTGRSRRRARLAASSISLRTVAERAPRQGKSRRR